MKTEVKINDKVFDGDLAQVIFAMRLAKETISQNLKGVNPILVDRLSHFDFECVLPVIGDPEMCFILKLEFPGAEACVDVCYSKTNGRFKIPSADALAFQFLATTEEGVSGVSFSESRLGVEIRQALKRSRELFSGQVATLKALEGLEI